MKISKAQSTRSDGRKQLVVLLPPELIDAVKKQAIDQGCHTYEVVEKALSEFVAVSDTSKR